MTTTRAASQLKGTMTVKKLMAALKDMPDDAPVVFICGYGDRCNTQQALFIESVDLLDHDEERLEESGYSDSGLALERLDDELDEEDDDVNEDETEEPCQVVLLR